MDTIINRIKGIIKKVDSTERSAFISMLLKPINMVLGLVYTPLLLSYLGTELYGLWATILSVISWINYFDVGIGHGLRNVLATELAISSNKIRKIVSTAYVLLTLISGVILAILIPLTFNLNLGNLFSTDIDMRIPLLISFIFICVNFVLALSNSILYAMQKAEMVSLRNIYVQLINIFGILLLKRFTTGNLIYVSVLFGLSTMLIYIYNTYKICSSDKNLMPSYRQFDKKYIVSVCNVGIKFFIIQLMCLLMFTLENMLITHYYGPEQVTPYSIVDKIFSTAYSVWAAFLIPYWSVTTTAVAENNIKWIKESLKKVSKIFTLFFFGYLLLALIFKPLVALWLHQELIFQPGIIALMCIYYILYSILAIECQFINGTGRINTQLILYLILGLISIPFSIFLGVYIGLGPFGIKLATTILVFVEDIILAFDLARIIKELSQTAL